MTRVALYARFSSDLQDGKSVEDQLMMLREEVRRKGWTVVEEYCDEAISGASIAKRPSLLRLMADAERRRFDVVMAEALDRLSRGQGDTAVMFENLADWDIRIVTLSEQTVESIHVAFKGLMNATFLQELGRKTRRGLMGRINEGRSAGGLTYGYRAVPGEVRGLLEIVDAEASVVMRIFTDYAREVSPRAIAVALNAEGVKGPRGNDWRASTISGQAHAGNGILNNELYIGKRIWNRRRKKKHPRTGKSRMVANPEDQWRTVDAPDMRIIPDELWRAVKARQRGYTQKGRSKSRRPTRLLSGLLQCGVCNGPMSIVGSTSYGCSNHREKGTCPNARTVSAALVESRVITGLQMHLNHPEAIREAAAAYHQAKAQARREAGGKKLGLEKDIAELGRRIDRIVDAIADGTAGAAMKAKLKALEAERESKEADLAGLAADDNIVAIRPKEAVAGYADLVGRLAEELASPEPENNELRQTLRGLITRIILSPSKGEKGYDFLIKGDLAALMGGRRVSLGVGAGTGFGFPRNDATAAEFEICA